MSIGPSAAPFDTSYVEEIPQLRIGQLFEQICKKRSTWFGDLWIVERAGVGHVEVSLTGPSISPHWCSCPLDEVHAGGFGVVQERAATECESDIV